ncbi:hypothetical protein HGG74_02390 [Arthrobacter sp. E918]|uniref:Uncharacterized protein n=1 Tax=Arthrobacter mobilis TaxID=2724944 RepID=A0A7X6HAC8_9MICC|nr:hypothetical protein [Arthrobacter mobilis]
MQLRAPAKVRQPGRGTAQPCLQHGVGPGQFSGPAAQPAGDGLEACGGNGSPGSRDPAACQRRHPGGDEGSQRRRAEGGGDREREVPGLGHQLGMGLLDLRREHPAAGGE